MQTRVKLTDNKCTSQNSSLDSQHKAHLISLQLRLLLPLPLLLLLQRVPQLLHLLLLLVLLLLLLLLVLFLLCAARAAAAGCRCVGSLHGVRQGGPNRFICNRRSLLRLPFQVLLLLLLLLLLLEVLLLLLLLLQVLLVLLFADSLCCPGGTGGQADRSSRGSSLFLPSRARVLWERESNQCLTVQAVAGCPFKGG
jgi:hypothetical protein